VLVGKAQVKFYRLGVVESGDHAGGLAELSKGCIHTTVRRVGFRTGTMFVALLWIAKCLFCNTE
jgi:hypothetical protein